VRVIAGFLRKVKGAGEHFPRLQFNRVATTGCIDRNLQLFSRMHANDFARRRSVCEGASDVKAR